MKSVEVERTDIRIVPDPSRVLIRPFIPRGETRIMKIISRVMSLPDLSVDLWLSRVMAEFSGRHIDTQKIFEHHYRIVSRYMLTDLEPSAQRRLLIGSLFTSEYALECAALFNPSIVPDPDQSGLARGALRFIMSLRATGEGHVSSISFRSGMIDKNYNITFSETMPFVVSPDPIENSSYDKSTFVQKLSEMGYHNRFCEQVLERLDDTFTLSELSAVLDSSVRKGVEKSKTESMTRDGIIWLAKSNYEIEFAKDQNVSQRIIFPTGPSEQNGIEDARFVLFENEMGNRVYYATYTAYDGTKILPQLMVTTDFVKFSIITLNGSAAQNKGMALFPRKIGGKFAMISRQDNENLYIMFSDNIHFWHEMIPLLKPTFPWEFVQVGNCGPPVETKDGWLLLTHGVGPMRKYCIGAILLDLENPRQVVGRLTEPLIAPDENEREGYVPNVVYTCGALIHKKRLIVPYAMSDYATSIATVDVESLLYRLKN